MYSKCLRSSGRIRSFLESASVMGRTGLQVSEIGLGCEGFVLKDDAFAEEIFRTA